MVPKLTMDGVQGQEAAGRVTGWLMVGLTLILMLLYGAALLGWVKPLADEKAVTRLEPIIFVIIGYYFGRLPSRQNESTLRGEISRQTQKADAAQHAKEHAQQVTESLEEKMKNVRATLAPAAASNRNGESFDKGIAPTREDALRQSVAAAVNILNS